MSKNNTESQVGADKVLDLWDYFDIGVLNTTAREDGSSGSPLGDGAAGGGGGPPRPESGFVVGMYAALLLVGGVGNVVVFTALLRSRRRKSRVNLLMTHLTVADMIVTFVVIPLEIGWRTTNAWLAGNAACKLFLVLRAFGLYLSSNVLVCISMDRFFAVLYPLRLTAARRRSKYMLCLAWMVALACSAPQGIVFRVLRHPREPSFEQCVAFGAFPTHARELAYNLFCLSAMYFLPLVLITVCYVCIFCEIATNSKELTGQSGDTDSTRVLLRRSDRSLLERARSRTLRMTVTIVSVFASCWLPYVTMTMWYMVDRQSAAHVPERVQDLFFIMAVSNSCMNPLVYGRYNFSCHPALRAQLRACCPRAASPAATGAANVAGDGATTATMPRALLGDKLNKYDLVGKASRLTHNNNNYTARFHESAASSTAQSEPLPPPPPHAPRVRASRSCDELSPARA